MFLRLVKAILVFGCILTTMMSLGQHLEPFPLRSGEALFGALAPPLLAAAAATLIVHDKWAKRAHGVVASVAALLWDARENALLRNVFFRARSGVEAAEQDWILLRSVIFRTSVLEKGKLSSAEEGLFKEYRDWVESEKDYNPV